MPETANTEQVLTGMLSDIPEAERSPGTCLFVLATAWGSQHGGLNAFNAEFVRALASADPWRTYRVVCLVLDAQPADIEDASRYGVELVSLDRADDKFSPESVTAAVEVLRDGLRGMTRVWIGHDTTTGHAALQMRDRFAGSRVVLIHHMAFDAYQEFKKNDSSAATMKGDEQRAMFSKADLCFAVGPMLTSQLSDLFLTVPSPPPWSNWCRA